ncbi:hypothetical protein VWZ88_01665 [Phaeobacter sp. JH20_36]|uniref:hypothetical protein n=1 Tax=Phaeobacter TaxID=302485 RepID=UPI000C9A92DA|nr:hypothetical protein [Phaeobacter inhibens]AUR03894.1 hypothetical protein PhaeoP72_01921 [Phaeobacter inhibens]
MAKNLLPIAESYLSETHIIKPGDRLHRLVSRLFDTHYDDLGDDRIEDIERHADTFRWMHADATPF